MPLYETDAFALRTYPFGEAHTVCVFFARQAGIIRGAAHGSRKLKSRYGAGLELFAEVHLKYREREGRDLIQLTDCELVKSHFEAASQPETAALLSYWAELLIEFLPAHQPNDHVYRLVGASLACVESGLDAGDALLRYFETWILKFSGFLPDFQSCAGCGRPFSPTESLYLARDGTPGCEGCGEQRGLTINPAVRHTILRILRRPPAEFASAPLDPQAQAVLREMNQQLITSALERKLVSYTVLCQIRAGGET